MKLVFLGPPGAGKGTQAVRMAEKYALQHASTGDIFRKAVAGGSELGQTVKSYLDGGRLVPDELTARVVGRVVIDEQESFILDGFPRTVKQAELLDQMLEDRNEGLDGVIYFQLGRDEAVERLTGRRMCNGCGRNYHLKFMPPARDMVCDDCGQELVVRSDSSPEVVVKRLEEYEEKTEPLVNYYRKEGLLKAVDASGPPDSVSEAAAEVIGKISRDGGS